MTDTGALRDYFEKRAPRYHFSSTNWPWNWLRRREADGVSDLIGDVTGREVLDLGCGAGYYTCFMLKRGANHVYSVDISQNMVAQLQSDRVTTNVADATTVDLGRHFKHIVCAGLLEFVPDPLALLRNTRRMADTDAVLVVLVPYANFWGNLYRAFHQRHGIKVRLFAAEELGSLATQTGWRVNKKRFVWPFTLLAQLRPRK